jgi:hypothetical protein
VPGTHSRRTPQAECREVGIEIPPFISEPPFDIDWVVRVAVNAKNAHGGFTGYETWNVWIRDGRVHRVGRIGN